MNGAGPAGWLRESGSRLPHSKVTVPVTGGGLVGRAWVGPGQRVGSGKAVACGKLEWGW